MLKRTPDNEHCRTGREQELVEAKTMSGMYDERIGAAEVTLINPKFLEVTNERASCPRLGKRKSPERPLE